MESCNTRHVSTLTRMETGLRLERQEMQNQKWDVYALRNGIYYGTSNLQVLYVQYIP